MRTSRLLVVLSALLSAVVAPSLSYAAAQLAAGAKTSAQPTATNPQLRALQITFDPDLAAATEIGAAAPSFHVDRFQLSVAYDATKLDVSNNDIQFIPPYTETPAGAPPTGAALSGGGPVADAASGAFIDTELGVISFIRGQAPLQDTQGGDANIFSITFFLKQGVSFDSLLSFTIFAEFDHRDFIHGTDPGTGESMTTFAGDITPTTITASFNDFAAQVAAASVPLPPGAVAGLIAMLVVGVWYRHCGRAWLSR